MGFRDVSLLVTGLRLEEEKTRTRILVTGFSIREYGEFG